MASDQQIQQKPLRDIRLDSSDGDDKKTSGVESDSTDAEGKPAEKKFYMAETETEDEGKGDSDPSKKNSIQHHQRVQVDESGSGGGRLPISPTEVILRLADEAIYAANSKETQTSIHATNRSISEVLRQKLSKLPIREEGNFTLGCAKIFHTRTRFLMMVMCLLCLASVWSNILCFNFAIICIEEPAEGGMEMVSNGVELPGVTDDSISAHLLNSTGPFDDSQGSNLTAAANNEKKHQGNLTSNLERESSVFSQSQKTYLTSAVAAAALVANFAVVSLVNNYGIRTTFAGLGLLSAIATCLLPAAIHMGFYYVLACRVLQGVAFSANFPVIGAFTSKWTYYKQNGLFVSALVAYVQLAPAITMPISGALCSTLGWPSVFFFHGVFTAVLFTMFGIFFRNSPNKHPFVGEVELRKIAVGKSVMSKEYQKKIPIGEILRTGSVWAIWIAAIGNFVCVNMMFLYTPTYFKYVLHFNVSHSGFSGALAPLAQFCIKLFAGFTSDKIRFLSETNKLRLYNSIAFFGSALFLTFLAFFPTEYPFICVALLGISAGLLGFTTGGFFKAGPLVAKHYALVVMGQISLAITLTLLFVPAMVDGIAKNNTAEEWRWVFLCTAGIMVLTNLAFCFLTSAEPAEWTRDDFSRVASRNKIYSTDAVNNIKPFSATTLH